MFFAGVGTVFRLFNEIVPALRIAKKTGSYVSPETRAGYSLSFMFVV